MTLISGQDIRPMYLCGQGIMWCVFVRKFTCIFQVCVCVCVCLCVCECESSSTFQGSAEFPVVVTRGFRATRSRRSVGGRWGGGGGRDVGMATRQDVTEVHLAMKLKRECNAIQGKQTESRASLVGFKQPGDY